MVRRIYITKNKNIKPEIKIISIEDYFVNRLTGIDTNGCSRIFDDMTGNFESLNIWNSETNLNGKNANTVKNKIKLILEDLQSKGYESRKLTKEDEESFTIPLWMFGHKESKNGKIYGEDYIDLPDDERIPILMFHLRNIYDICNKYDENYFCFYIKAI